jgi:hypothetical protein
MSASRVCTVTIHCNGDEDKCPATVTGVPNESDYQVRTWLRKQGWATSVPEGHLVADYCPRCKAARGTPGRAA